MADLRRSFFILALVTASAFGLSPGLRADTISTTTAAGTYTVGLYSAGSNVFGTLIDQNNTTIGFANPKGFDPFTGGPGSTPREAYGVSVSGPGVNVSGFVDPLNLSGNGGIVNIVPVSHVTNPSSATVVTALVNPSNSQQVLLITQNFNFVPNNPNVLQDTTTLTNLTNQFIQAHFRRLTEFTQISTQNPPPVGQNNTLAIVSPPQGPVTGTTPFLFPPPPGSPPTSANPNVPFPIPASGTFSTPGAYGSGIDLNLDTLAPPGLVNQPNSITFNMFFATSATGPDAGLAAGANQSEAQLLQQLAALGINFTIAGTNSSRDEFLAPAGFNTGVVGLIIPTIPEPATVSLLGLGLAGLAAWRRRRKASA
jgi:hypothetical protein